MPSSEQNRITETNNIIMTFLVVLAFFVAFILILYLLSPLVGPKKIDLQGKHVLITGGSSGIGKAMAIEVVKQGASVTLLARNQSKLSESKDEVEKHFIDRSTQRVVCISVDLSKDYNHVEKAVRQAEELLGGVAVLINCAGTSSSARFDDTAISEFKRMMEINYLGSVYATRAVISSMKSRQEGRIVFVSSQAGQLGLYGYTAYAASKFALRGLAESLQMEVKPYNIQVTLTFPPDTDTPGFAEEIQSKPEETKMISETAGLFQSDYVAKAILQDVIKGQFLSFVGVDGFMLCTVTSGMSPVTSITEAVQQALLMGPFRSISLLYLRYFDYIISKCKKSREESSREKSD